MKKIIFLGIFFSLSVLVFGQYTIVPDPAFEAYLESNGWGDGKSNNQKVLTSKVSEVRAIGISNLGIQSLEGIQDFKRLEYLWCSDNEITSVDLSNLSLLKILHFPSNKLVSIDLSSNPNLTWINLKGNNLGNLFMKGISASQLDHLITHNNDHLTEIEVDFSFSPTAVGNLAIESHTVFTDAAKQKTYIPGDNFRNKIETLSGISPVSGPFLFTNEVAQIIHLSAKNGQIEDVTGLEDFVNLEILDLQDNVISAIDLSKLTKLENLNLANNSISEVDLSANVNLKRLLLYSCDNLTDIDLTNNVLLEQLSIHTTPLSALYVSNCKELTYLIAFGCNLKFLDLRNNRKLDVLHLVDNEIESLDLRGTVVRYLYLNSNKLKYLNLPHSNLTALDIRDNNLVNLDLSNNSSISSMKATGNPLLTCIKVADESASFVNWQKDSGVIYTETGCEDRIHIPDPALERLLQDFGNLNTTPNDDGFILMSEASSIERLLIFDYLDVIHDLSGIEAFPHLTSISLSHLSGVTSAKLGSASDISISNCPNLIEVDIENQVSYYRFWISDNQSLEKINFGDIANGYMNIYNCQGSGGATCPNDHFDRSIENCPNLSCIVISDLTQSNRLGDESPLAVKYPHECGTSSSQKQGLTFDGNNSISDVKLFELYPTVVEDIITVESKSDASYSLLNSIGELVKEGKLEEGTNQLLVGDLSLGAYIIRLSSENGTESHKMIKE